MTKIQICPICEKNPVSLAFKPFCSKRCADVDLSRWFSGAYNIPGRTSDDADDTPDAHILSDMARET